MSKELYNYVANIAFTNSLKSNIQKIKKHILFYQKICKINLYYFHEYPAIEHLRCMHTFEVHFTMIIINLKKIFSSEILFQTKFEGFNSNSQCSCVQESDSKNDSDYNCTRSSADSNGYISITLVYLCTR